MKTIKLLDATEENFMTKKEDQDKRHPSNFVEVVRFF